MEFTKEELKTLSEIIEMDMSEGASRYGNDLEVYKKSQSYKEKSALYEKVQSEYFGRKMKITENSIFELLDI